MYKKYKKPPIIQSVCEFRFSENEWNNTYPGLCYNKLKSEYKKVEEVSSVESQIVQQDDGKIINQVRTLSETKFSNEEEKRFIHVGKNRLSIIKEKPYCGWQEYLPHIKKSFSAYNDVSKQKSINRIGLRYTNHIFIEKETFDEKEYFNVYPEYTILKRDCNASELKLSFMYDNDVLNVLLMPKASDEEILFYFDLDYFTVNYKSALKFNDIESWLKNAHDSIADFFEKSITDKTRKLFK